jgi:hypothetical protein
MFIQNKYFPVQYLYLQADMKELLWWKVSVIGLEFSGHNQKGQQVMGMMTSGSLASMLLPDKNAMWNVPKH